MLDVAVTLSCELDVSTSSIVKLTEPAVSSTIEVLAIVVMVGVSLTAFTVKTKLASSVSRPSLSVTVIVLVPLLFASGVSVTVFSLPVPATDIPDAGSNNELLDVTLYVKSCMFCSLSLSDRENVAVPSSLIVFVLSALIVGAVLRVYCSLDTVSN